jgi:hypothetical protein
MFFAPKHKWKEINLATGLRYIQKFYYLFSFNLKCVFLSKIWKACDLYFPNQYFIKHSVALIIEISVECGSIQSTLVERWKLSLRNSKNPEKTSSNEINLNLFFQALKSTLHFSPITAILEQDRNGVKIHTR